MATVTSGGAMKTCGCMTRLGDKCKRPAGHGLGLDYGPCSQHSTDEAVSQAQIKKEFLRLLPDPLMTVSNIATEMGIPIRSLYGMRGADPIFEKEWIVTMMTKENFRTEIIEESMFKRASDEKIQNPAETIFWLKNRAPTRWRDKVVQEVTGADGRPLMPIDALRSFLIDESDEQKQLPPASDSEIVIEETK